VYRYSEDMDPELQRVFNAAVAAGVNVFDTADSYGTGNGLDGRSEVLLGRGCSLPGVRLVHMDHTGCHVDHTGCHVHHTGCHRLVFDCNITRKVTTLLSGKFLRECPSPKVSEVQIATKFAAYPWWGLYKSGIQLTRP
jgi:pyridoxine 4-dehydrogenase